MFGYMSFFAAALLTAMLMLAFPESASAQELPTEAIVATSPIEEIIVRSRKREENLQSVPISISTFSEEDIRIRDIYNLERLADQTPGLSFATAGSVVNRRPVIRGFVQQTRVGDEPNVATFIDGIYTPGLVAQSFLVLIRLSALKY